MSREILKIVKKQPEVTTLPDGIYQGTWGW